MPGGLGSTFKVLMLGKGVGSRALLGGSFRNAHVSRELAHPPCARPDRRSRHAAAAADPGTGQAAMPVAGEPLAGRIVRWLAWHGVSDLVLNLHTCRKRSPATGRRQRPRRARSLFLGTAGRPWQRRRPAPGAGHRRRRHVFPDQRRHADRRHLAGSGDAHRSTGASVTLALVPNREPEHYGGVRLDADSV